jgi:hypothetical protein
MEKHYVKHNPLNKPEDQLPVIYGYCEGGQLSNLVGKLIAEDGKFLGQHICSSEGWMYGDLGITDPDSGRHKDFKEHYPEGYRMQFVSYNHVKHHVGLQDALVKHMVP